MGNVFQGLWALLPTHCGAGGSLGGFAESLEEIISDLSKMGKGEIWWFCAKL
jgi:hypothetical protein